MEAVLRRYTSFDEMKADEYRTNPPVMFPSLKFIPLKCHPERTLSIAKGKSKDLRFV